MKQLNLAPRCVLHSPSLIPKATTLTGFGHVLICTFQNLIQLGYFKCLLFTSFFSLQIAITKIVWNNRTVSGNIYCRISFVLCLKKRLRSSLPRALLISLMSVLTLNRLWIATQHMPHVLVEIVSYLFFILSSFITFGSSLPLCCWTPFTKQRFSSMETKGFYRAWPALCFINKGDENGDMGNTKACFRTVIPTTGGWLYLTFIMPEKKMCYFELNWLCRIVLHL